MQSACGGREGAGGAGVDAGGKKVDRWILVFVGAAGVGCAESGGRRSGQAGYGGGRAENALVGRVSGCVGGRRYASAGGGAVTEGGEREGAGAGGGEGIYCAGRGCDSFSAQRMNRVVSDQFSVISFRKREEKKITQRR